MTVEAQMPMRRDAAWVNREYGEQKWVGTQRDLERLIEHEAGPLPLARAISGLTRLEIGDWGSATSEVSVVIDGRLVSLPLGAAWGIVQAMVPDYVLDAVTPQTDAIIELGAGWGRHLFRIWVEGGYRDVRHIAAEYTEAGREAARRVGALDPVMPLEVVEFDYHHPDRTALAPMREVVVYSIHSLEQIPHVRPQLVEWIAGLGRRVTCLHFEPVGWQIDPDSIGSSRGYAEAHDYNRDLVAVLRDAAAAGRIELDAPRVDIVGLNTHNSSTLLRWTAGPEPSA